MVKTLLSEEDTADKIRHTPEGRLWVSVLASLDHDIQMAETWYGTKYARRARRAERCPKYQHFFREHSNLIDESMHQTWLFLYGPDSALDIICGLIGYHPDRYRSIGRKDLEHAWATRRIARENVLKPPTPSPTVGAGAIPQ